MSLQIQNLCDGHRIRIEEDLVRELARLPKSLAGIYSQIMDNISQIETRGRNIAETVLRWLLCTQEASPRIAIPLCSRKSSTELRDVTIQNILDVCCNLVVFDERLRKFRFTHLSVREYLESQPRFTASDANSWLVEKLFEIWIHVESLNEIYIRRYAKDNWITHYKNLEERSRKRVFELYAQRFFFDGAETNEAFTTWASEARNLGLDFIHDPSNASSISLDPKRNPLELACRFGWLEILDYYETNHCRDGFRGPTMNMMTLAVRHNHPPLVRWLLNRHVRPDDDQLKLAFIYRRQELIRNFYNENLISVDALVDGQSLLALAICNNLEDLVHEFVEKGANVNFRDPAGRTPLSYVISQRSSIGILDILVQAGAYLGAHDHIGGPLAWAAYVGNVSLVQSILDRGIDPNLKNRKDQTALYFAVQNTEDKYSRIDLETDKETIC